MINSLSAFFFFFLSLRQFIYMYHIPRKRIQGFPLLCVFVTSSWSMMPAEVVSTVKPDGRDGSRLFCHFSRCLSCTSNLGPIAPHLFSLPVRFTAVCPAL